ncbi:hypothetical protein QN239_27390 [Mycolicibacterium sp. Y3]
MASDNELLLDVEVDPWGSTISIEDLDTDDRPGVPEGFKTEIWCWSTIHSIDVYTMSQDESETTERLVRVRVYRGTDSVGLGERAFDGDLELTTGTLAVGAYLGTPPEEQQLHLSPGLVHLQIFTEKAIQTVHYDLPEPGEYPISGPTDINVLILPT